MVVDRMRIELNGRPFEVLGNFCRPNLPCSRYRRPAAALRWSAFDRVTLARSLTTAPAQVTNQLRAGLRIGSRDTIGEPFGSSHLR